LLENEESLAQTVGDVSALGKACRFWFDGDDRFGFSFPLNFTFLGSEHAGIRGPAAALFCPLSSELVYCSVTKISISRRSAAAAKSPVQTQLRDRGLWPAVTLKTSCLRKEGSGWSQVLARPWCVGLCVDLHHFILNPVKYKFYGSCTL